MTPEKEKSKNRLSLQYSITIGFEPNSTCTREGFTGSPSDLNLFYFQLPTRASLSLHFRS